MTTNPIIRKRIFASNLTMARKRRDLLQKQVAAELNIPHTTYSSYEEGRSEPPLVILRKIAEVLRVSVDALLNENSEELRLSKDAE